MIDKLFQDVMPQQNVMQDPNQPNVNTTQINPTPSSGILDTFGLSNINPFFTRRDPFISAIAGNEVGDKILNQATGQGFVTGGLTYALTGDPIKSYLAGMEGSQKSVDKRRQSIFDMIKYSKEMKEYNLMDFNALPNEYKVFGMMKNDPTYAKYQFAKDMFTTDIKEFEYSQQADGFIDFLKTMANAKRPQYTTTIGIANKNASDAMFKDVQGVRDEGNKAYAGKKSVIRMQDILNSGLKTGLGKEIALNLTQPLQLLLGDKFNAKEISQLEDFKAISNLVVLPQVKQLGFNPTNVDLAFIVKSSPQLLNTTQGNLLMLKALEEDYTRQEMLALKMDEWVIANAGLMTDDPIVAGAKYNQYRNQVAREIVDSRQSYTKQLMEEQNQILNNTSIDQAVEPKTESKFFK
jgi:hypothetical protein